MEELSVHATDHARPVHVGKAGDDDLDRPAAMGGKERLVCGYAQAALLAGGCHGMVLASRDPAQGTVDVHTAGRNQPGAVLVRRGDDVLGHRQPLLDPLRVGRGDAPIDDAGAFGRLHGSATVERIGGEDLDVGGQNAVRLLVLAYNRSHVGAHRGQIAHDGSAQRSPGAKHYVQLVHGRLLPWPRQRRASCRDRQRGHGRSPAPQRAA